ncbi:growth-regulating factor 3-like isoform X2 [Musa acuminata AAA Group]|uniref:growth-regulating factor 3-like isoform X2 n=1 Tax=Musa acuminata AAA Group TaxID=214697 RepID=UPI0031DA0640
MCRSIPSHPIPSIHLPPPPSMEYLSVFLSSSFNSHVRQLFSEQQQWCVFYSVSGVKVTLLSMKEAADLSQTSSEATDPPLHCCSKTTSGTPPPPSPNLPPNQAKRSRIKSDHRRYSGGSRGISFLLTLGCVFMDSHQWRGRLQSDRQPSAGLPKLQFLDHQQSPASAIGLLGPEHNSSLDNTLSPFPSYFTLAQWQELELQALIYKYMIAGVSVPLELVLPIKRSLLGASPFSHRPELYHQLQPSWLQTGYWGRWVVDPEPGRCRRTDGKKWRCSREVVVGQKYCERHVHRGRNRSRKHVEIPTPTSTNGFKAALSSPAGLPRANHFDPSPSLPTLDILPLDQRDSDSNTVERSFQSDRSNFCLGDNKAEGYVLQKFFDEWPKSQQEANDTVNYTSHPASATHLSISIPGNLSSDFSLKLSTGNDAKKPRQASNNDGADGQLVCSSNNWSGWGHHGEASMGGPLAEALRSSASTHSPTSVLHKPNGSVSETSGISP